MVFDSVDDEYCFVFVVGVFLVVVEVFFVKRVFVVILGMLG